eukprot:NODE_427_length_8836_cov_0.452215.p2 type:complete len:413 gc:universal NODE_427_length_8836_cov_0.452215:2209-971(-)
MLIQASRLRELIKADCLHEVKEENEELVVQIQNHPYVEEIPQFEKEKLEPYLEDQDEIRALNILINQAKCAAVRDKQLLEKKSKQKELELYDIRMDNEVDMARLETIQRQDVQILIEKKKKTDNANNIRSQIAEKKIAKESKRIIQEVESKKQLEEFQKLALQEETVKALNRIKKKEYINVIIESNRKASERRKDEKTFELEADKNMLKYTMEKIEKELEAEQKKKKELYLREKAYASTLVTHKKSSEKKNNKDEVLALKAAYDYELKCRAEESKKKETSQANRENLIKERIKLKQIKESNLKLELAVAQKQHNEILSKQLLVDEKMKTAQVLKKKELDQFLTDIKGQIDEKRKIKKEDAIKFQSEWTHFNDEIKSKQLIIDHLKHKKVQSLEQLGVPEKYLYDVKKFVSHK